MKKLKILFIEPFYGGSHKNFTDGLIKYSSHDYRLYTLPARYWKWRMRGAALHFSQKIKNPSEYDLLFTSDMMSLSDLKMLWRDDCPPAVVYFHENQLSYPLPEGEKMDYQFGFTDITTALASERLLFNSHFHMNSFLDSMPGFIRKMPEYKPLWAVDKIRVKASVLYPGCDFPEAEEAWPNTVAGISEENAAPAASSVPLILWNHRWEFDKCPEIFFNALKEADGRLKSAGVEIPFNIAVLGENFQAKPKAFIEAKEYFGERILQYGYCDSRAEYISWLQKSDIVISTAVQENFGISIVEAIRYGCFPLLPDRLSYPELIPDKFHKDVIYGSDADLAEKLTAILSNIDEANLNKNKTELSSFFSKYSWESAVRDYDEFFYSVLQEPSK